MGVFPNGRTKSLLSFARVRRAPGTSSDVVLNQLFRRNVNVWILEESGEHLQTLMLQTTATWMVLTLLQGEYRAENQNLCRTEN